MIVFNQEVFDETIGGTTDTWYTSAEFNDLLGTADYMAVFAMTTDVSSPAPTLKLWVDQSNDNEHWNPVATPKINSTIADQGVLATVVNEVNFGFCRLRVHLDGTSPKCRLRLGVTGRVVGS